MSTLVYCPIVRDLTIDPAVKETTEQTLTRMQPSDDDLCNWLVSRRSTFVTPDCARKEVMCHLMDFDDMLALKDIILRRSPHCVSVESETLSGTLSNIPAHVLTLAVGLFLENSDPLPFTYTVAERVDAPPSTHPISVISQLQINPPLMPGVLVQSMLSNLVLENIAGRVHKLLLSRFSDQIGNAWSHAEIWLSLSSSDIREESGPTGSSFILADTTWQLHLNTK